jgi:hypothetical protein
VNFRIVSSSISAVVLSWAMAFAVEASQGGERQPRARIAEIQGESGEDVLDEVLAYRFWLSPVEARTELVAMNRSDREGRLVVVHLSPGGASQTLLKSAVVAGATFVLPAAELLKAAVGNILVKAPRRLELALVRGSGEDSVIRIPTHPNAVFYDVFSAARQFDVDQEAHRKVVERVERGQRVVWRLGGQDAGTNEAALRRKLARVNAERSEADLFISYWVK